MRQLAHGHIAYGFAIDGNRGDDGGYKHDRDDYQFGLYGLDDRYDVIHVDFQHVLSPIPRTYAAIRGPWNHGLRIHWFGIIGLVLTVGYWLSAVHVLVNAMPLLSAFLHGGDNTHRESNDIHFRHIIMLHIHKT
jgi:hypothetical protein